MGVKIYTKTGDRGQTSLYGGKRVPKSHYRVNAYGTIDELNSLLGVVVVKMNDSRVKEFVNQVQKDLFLIGGNLAGAQTKLDELKLRVKEMERIIDWIDGQIPGLKNFVLPGGNESAAFLYLSRAVARRAERELVALLPEEQIDGKILIYMNRLSDLLFMMARYINFKANFKETIWRSS